MDFSLDMFFRQEWNDPRLAHNLTSPIILEGQYRDLIWIPDTFFHNIRTANFHNVPSLNCRVLLNPSGRVEYSTRITLTASCLMNFRRFPMDTQVCNLQIESYSYDVHNVEYFWKNNGGNKPHVWKKELPEFELRSIIQEKHLDIYSTGTFSTLTMQFVFERRLGYSLLQMYFPTFLIVTLSWLSFWISKEAAAARVALGITTILTSVTLMASFRHSVPKVSYIKALDWYFMVSLFFVFGSTLEYVVVVAHADLQAWRKKKTSVSDKMSCPENTKLHSIKQTNQAPARGTEEGNSTCRCQPNLSNSKRAMKFKLPFFLRREASIIDRVSRVLFPLVYFVFMFLYWIIYLT